jgi:CheY-like chemotaxis protein
MPSRILIVEDEYLIRLLLEDMIADLGYEVGAVAATLSEGMTQARDAQVDLAILDVNIDGAQVFPLAELLKQRKVPFVFITGYGQQGLPESYRASPTLQKPFQMQDLKTTLAKILGA